MQDFYVLLYSFCFVLFWTRSPRRKLIGGFFCITSLGGLYLERFIRGGAYFTEFYGI